MNKKRIIFIEKTAETVRNDCNITDYGFHNIFESAEKINYRVIRYPIGENEFLGFALTRDNERIIFSNSSLIKSREIFTIAHEIGHQKLHLLGQEKTMIKDDDFDGINEYEVEANYFAACLLMPDEKVKKFIRLELNDKPVEEWNGLDIAKIQTSFNVSYDMVLNRLNALSLINSSIYNKLKKEKIEKTATKLLNVINGNIDLCAASGVKKIPAEFLEWVITNYNQKLIPFESFEMAMNYVDLNAEDFREPTEKAENEDTFEELLRGMD